LRSSPPLIETVSGGELRPTWEFALPAGVYKRPYYSSPAGANGKVYLHLSPGADMPPPPPKAEPLPKKKEAFEDLLESAGSPPPAEGDVPDLGGAKPRPRAPAPPPPAPKTVKSDHADDVLLCVDLATGQEKWRFSQPGGPSKLGAPNTPCIHEGRAYFVGSSGVLYCLDAESGQSVWRSEAGGSDGRAGTYSSSVLLVDGKVVVADRKLVAVDARDGTKAWEAAVAVQHNSPAVWANGGKRYVIGGGEEVACVAAEDGQVLWRTPGGKGAASLVVEENTLVTLFADTGLTAYRLGIEGAEKVVQWPIEPAGMGHQTCTPCVDGKLVYAWDRVKSFCYDIEKKEAVWQGESPRDGKPSPILADGKLICSNTGRVWGLDAATGKTLFWADVKVAGCTSVALVSGHLLVNADTHLRCYRLARE
jgi:outer membrane protein assembly factor BamB